MEVYLDNSATTRVCDEALQAAVDVMKNEYGNPSSLHSMGYRAGMRLQEAARTLADIWKCAPEEVIFTSGGSESDNLAVLGAARAMARKGKHIITTAVEHPAVAQSIKALEAEGFEAQRLGTDSRGIVSLEELSEAVREDTVLVSIMHVNNETGAVQSVEEAAELVKKKNPACLFHTDDIQGFTKVPLRPGRTKIDLLSISGHKIHAPKGIGALYVKKGVRLLAQIHGGGQQGGIRNGTENVPGAVALSAAAARLWGSLEEDIAALYSRRRRLVERLRAIPGVTVNGPEDEKLSAPHIISVTAKGVRSEVLLHALEEKGIYVSAGSACSSHKRAPSPSLLALGLSGDSLQETVRLSLSVFNTDEELDYAAGEMAQLIPALGMFKRR